MSVDRLRETHHVNRVTPSDIGVLWSAQSYRPEITKAIRDIKSRNWKPLQNLVANPISPGLHPVYGGPYSCLKTKNVQELLADLAPADYADVSGIKYLKSYQVKKGDLLINLTGAGSIGRVSIYYGDDKPITNQHIARMTILDGYDEGYVGAFLRSWWGERALEQGVAGSTGQINMVNDHVRSIPVLLPNQKARKYIGNKVRQAERLRAWARYYEQIIKKFISDFQPPPLTFHRLQNIVEPALLTHMLTATTYRDKYVENQRFLKSNFSPVPLGSFFSSIANGFDEREEKKTGLPYIKVADVRPDNISTAQAGRVSYECLNEASYEQIPKNGDLLITRKGSFGIAAVVMEDAPFLVSSEVFVCKPKSPQLMPVLSAFLNSTSGRMQFEQFSTGTTMPGINQGNLSNILVPSFQSVNIDRFIELYSLRFSAIRMVLRLIDAAKFTVEALIEGKITEPQLIAAQQALESGDNTLDREILSRLKTDGLDGEGGPLFPDLDRLYELLDQAERASEA